MADGDPTCAPTEQLALAETQAPDAGEAPLFAPGTFLGRYEIQSVLGQGGMGTVYAARDPDLDRTVAIKVLRDHRGGDSARKRLLREARAMARLSHPNVITVHEVASDHGTDFIVMALIEGESLEGWLSRGRAWRDIVAVFGACGRGLAAAHDAGLIHRDFKPANVLISGDGNTVVVTDFGLARSGASDTGDDPAQDPARRDPPPGTTRAPVAAAHHHSLATVTDAGAVAGTPAYMSPEQHHGDRLDARSDQFSFCAALYEALFGVRPFAGTTLASLGLAKIERRLAPIPDKCGVPARIRRVVVRGLAPEPEARFPSMTALVAALSRDPRRRLVAAAMVAVVAILAAVTILAVLSSGSAAPGLAAVCEDDHAIDTVWNDAARHRLASALAADGDAAAQATVTSVVRIFDAYAGDYKEARRRACTAALIDHTVPEADFLLARSCLVGRKNDLSALIDALATSGAASAERAVAAAEELSPPAACADYEALAAGIPPPKDARARAEATRIRAELSAIDAAAKTTTKDGEDLIARAQAAVSSARAAAYRPVIAEALVTEAEILAQARHADKAQATIDEAIVVAEEAGYTSLRARALVTKMAIWSRFSTDYPEILKLGRRARAALGHGASDPSLSASLNLSLARVYHDLGDYDRAGQIASAALKTLRQMAGESPTTRVGRALFLLAEIRAHLKQSGEATRLRREALAMFRETLGDGHRQTQRAALMLLVSLRAGGHFDEARALEERRIARARPPAKRRTVTGKVIDARGDPQPGARVMVSPRPPIADSYNTALLQHGFAGTGAAIGEAGPDGAFSLSAGAGDLFAVAESDAGRSPPVPIKAGKPARVVLTLIDFGRLEGQVTPWKAGEHWGLLTLSAYAENHMALVTDVGDDGRFAIARIPAGDYDVRVLEARGEGEGTLLATIHTRVRPHTTTTMTIPVDIGPVTLDVAVKGEGGVKVLSAAVNLMPGRGRVRSFADILHRVEGAGQGGSGAAFSTPGRPARFAHVRAGTYTVCVTPFPHGIHHPRRGERYRDLPEDRIPVDCHPITVAETPAEQTVTVTVPPTLSPLPR